MYLPDTAILVTRFVTRKGSARCSISCRSLEPEHELIIGGSAGAGRPGPGRPCSRSSRLRLRAQGALEHTVEGRSSAPTSSTDGARWAAYSCSPSLIEQRPRQRRVWSADATAPSSPAISESSWSSRRPGHAGRPRRAAATVRTRPWPSRVAGSAGRAAWALARADRPLGYHLEAHDLRTERRARRLPDRRTSRAGRRRAQLGLPLHLDPRRLVLGLSAARPRLRRGGGRLQRWLWDRMLEPGAESATPRSKIMYRVDGCSDLVEETLDHWEGYRARSRCGSATAPPSSCSSTSTARPWTPSRKAGGNGMQEAERVGRNWATCSTGWPNIGTSQRRRLGDPRRPAELRLLAENCWIALDRGSGWPTGRPARGRGGGEPIGTTSTRGHRGGWNAERRLHPVRRQRRPRCLGAAHAPVGIIEPHDPKWQSTLAAMDRNSSPTAWSTATTRKHRPTAARLGGDLLALLVLVRRSPGPLGALGRSWLTFEKMLTYANHLGPLRRGDRHPGERLGDFPQAFTHLSLINAALNLDYQLDHGVGETQPMLSRLRQVPATGFR